MNTPSLWFSLALAAVGLSVGCGESLPLVGPSHGPGEPSADAQAPRDEASSIAAGDVGVGPRGALTALNHRVERPRDASATTDGSATTDASGLDARDSVSGDAALPEAREVGASADDTPATIRDARADDDRATDAEATDAGATDLGASEDTHTSDLGATVDVAAPPDGSVTVAGWDLATVAHVREVRDRGVVAGNRPGVFAKIGDSITESGSFLSDVGFGWVQLGAYGSLDATIRTFQSTALGDANSFNRASVCATAGWTTDDALAGGADSPLQRELRAIRPSWALIMYGTNDLDRSAVAAYAANLNLIADACETAGTVPVFSTIPDRRDTTVAAARVLVVNDAIRVMTATRHLPRVELWEALQPVPQRGLSEDGIHPSVYRAAGSTQPADFTAAGLMYGYNVRNLTAIQMLARLRALP